MTGFARWCLRTAARRWPAEIRDEMEREWLAELAAIDSPRRRLGFALSLLTSPPLRDAAGAPRGWSETVSAMVPALAVVTAGFAAFLVGRLVDALAQMAAGMGSFGFALYFDGQRSLLTAPLLVGWAVVAGRWLGRRRPMAGDGRFGAAASAALAPLGLVPAFLLGAAFQAEAYVVYGALIAAALWTPGAMLLGLAVARSGRARAVLLACVGAPLLSVLAVVPAAAPMVLTSPGGVSVGLRAAWASLTMAMPPDEFMVIPDGALSSRTFVWFTVWMVALLGYSVLALAYGRAALRPRPARSAVPVPAPEGGPTVAATTAAVAGAVVVAAGVLAWAYTVAILSPDMDRVSVTAPVPGGADELFMWVAELRWAALLLASLGMLAAVAERRHGILATLALAAGLIAANAALVRAGVSGVGGLQLALLAGGAAVVAGWALAGPPRRRYPEVTRGRVAVASVTAAGCGPLVLLQGTPVENHPYLSVWLTVTTTGVAVAAVLLAVIGALTVRDRRPPLAAVIALLVLPAGAVAAAGVYLGNGVDETRAQAGALIAGPLAVLLVGLMRRHRPRRRGGTGALWTALTLAAVVLTPVVVLMSLFGLNAVPNLLFGLEAGGWGADGLSIVPGALALVLPLAVFAARRLDDVPAPEALVLPRLDPEVTA